jgi:hypothetical protein
LLNTLTSIQFINCENVHTDWGGFVMSAGDWGNDSYHGIINSLDFGTLRANQLMHLDWNGCCFYSSIAETGVVHGTNSAAILTYLKSLFTSGFSGWTSSLE